MAQAPTKRRRRSFSIGGDTRAGWADTSPPGFRSGRQTGVLHLDQDGATKRVYFKKGDIVFASSDVGTERIGEILARSGKLTRSELELACEVRESSHLRLGKTLVDMGYVSDSELDALVKRQVESILLSLILWETGSYRAELRDNALDEKDEDLLRADISTENILLETVRGLDDSDAIRSSIGNLTEPLRFARDPEWIGKNLRLTPEEGFVLSRVDGESSADGIARLSPMGEIETLRCICALVVAGVLEIESTRAPDVSFTPVEPLPKAAAPRPNAVESPPIASPPKPVEAPPRDMAASPTSTPTQNNELSETARQFREEMLRKHHTAHQVTYYELLDVDVMATPDEIKAGYFRLAKKLHPDHRAGLKIHDPDGAFDDLYLAVKAAYEVLSSETERRRYDFSLEKKRPKPATPAPEPPPAANTTTRPKPKEKVPAGPPPQHYDARQMARLHFANGQRFFNEGSFHESIEELQDAVRLDGGQGEYHRLLGYALAKNPKWRRRAETHLLKVLEIDRFDIDTMIALGEIYEAGGVEQRARKIYEEALGLDPGNRRALEKLGGAPRTNTIDKLKGMLHRSKGH